MARLHVRGRIFTVCERLIEPLQPVCYARANKIDAQLDPERFMAEPDKYESDATPIKPQRLMRELTWRFPASTRFCCRCRQQHRPGPCTTSPTTTAACKRWNAGKAAKNGEAQSDRRSGKRQLAAHGSWIGN